MFALYRFANDNKKKRWHNKQHKYYVKIMWLILSFENDKIGILVFKLKNCDFFKIGVLYGTLCKIHCSSNFYVGTFFFFIDQLNICL